MFFKIIIKSLLVVFTASVFVSCGEYQKLLRSEDNAKKYLAVDSLYNSGKYKKALGLMEQIVPAFRGKPQAQSLMFKYANTFYELEDYVLAGYQFDRFVTSYPKSDSAEVASYKSAKSYFELSPRFSLDQKDTFTALEKLQEFVDRYPTSEFRKETNQMSLELKEKLERKDYETCKQYFKIYDYKSCIGAIDNFIVDHPGSKYREEMFFTRFNAEYLLAINSFPHLVEERLQVAIKYYEAYLKYFSGSESRAEADKIFEDINQRLSVINTEIN